MRRILTVAATAAVLLGAGTALADDAAGNLPGTSASVGVGMICDTQEQAARFIALRAAGTEIKPAMQQVNAESKDPRACGIAAIAYIPDKTVASASVGETLLQVVRINIIAGFNGSSWQHVSGMTQYAVIEAAGESI
jgi:hypothetical protein